MTSGKNFKLTYKAVNCREMKAPVMRCLHTTTSMVKNEKNQAVIDLEISKEAIDKATEDVFKRTNSYIICCLKNMLFWK